MGGAPEWRAGPYGAGPGKEFRGFRAVDGVDLDVAEGSVHALVGPNGAGKTTLFNLLTGFLQPTRGRDRARRRGAGRAPPRADRPGSAWRARSRSPACSPQLTPREHVELALQGGTGLGWRFWRSDRKLAPLRATARWNCSTQVGPGRPRRTRRAGALSYGRKRALELALALALDPKVLLLDEPTAGMGVEDVDRDRRADRPDPRGPHRRPGRAQHERGRQPRRPRDRPAAGKVLVEGPYAEIRARPARRSPPTWETPMLTH